MISRRHPRHYDQALRIIEAYEGNTPFPIYLSDTFRRNKNWGSKDRRSYRELCYLYLKNFRLFKNAENPTEILISLDSDKSNYDPDPYFEFYPDISKSIEKNELARWFHKIPPIFYFPWDKNIDLTGLNARKLSEFQTWIFSNQPSLNALIDKGEGIIQDVSSTQVIQSYATQLNGKKVWDCCAGAGGKALMIEHLSAPSELICSDIRPQILENLRSRFKLNRKKEPQLRVMDISSSESNLSDLKPEIILADVPCSGSGTWRRNPEVLKNFEVSQLDFFKQRQKRILKTLSTIDSAEYIIYCTCSIFKGENEEVISEFLSENQQFSCQNMMYHGHIRENENVRGDYLFSALLKRL